MEETESKTMLVAWIDDNTIFVGKNDKYIVMNPFTKDVKQQQSFRQRSERSLDIAVNKTNTQYAISFGNSSIRCFDAKTHIRSWHNGSNSNNYMPITFNSQDKDEIIFVQQFHVSSLGFPLSHDHMKGFYSVTVTPLSCHPSRSTILFHRNLSAGYTIDTLAKNQCFFYDITDVECQSIRGTRFSFDGNHILVNLGNKLKTYTDPYLNTGPYPMPPQLINIIETTTEAAFIAFECCKNTTLAALTANSTVAFYEYLTGTLLSLINLSDPVPTIFDETEKYLSVSPNKKNLLVATQKGHLIVPLSLDTQYGQGMEELATIFLLLKPFLSTQD